MAHLNEHSTLRQIKDPQSLPIPTDIRSPPNSHEHSPLQASWGEASPLKYAGPTFSATAMIAPAPHATPVLPLHSTPTSDIDAIIK